MKQSTQSFTRAEMSAIVHALDIISDNELDVLHDTIETQVHDTHDPAVASCEIRAAVRDYIATITASHKAEYYYREMCNDTSNR